MKKLLAVLALLTVSTVGLADDDEVKVVPVEGAAIYIIDEKKVYKCWTKGCLVISTDYTKSPMAPKQ